MHIQHRIDRRRPHGFMLLEILIAIAFLAVATGFVLTMHQARLDYDRSSMDRLRQQLVIENIAEQLAPIPYEELNESAAKLAAKSGVDLDTESFEHESRKGTHFVLRITSKGGPLEQHYWRLEPTR